MRSQSAMEATTVEATLVKKQQLAMLSTVKTQPELDIDTQPVILEQTMIDAEPTLQQQSAKSFVPPISVMQPTPFLKEPPSSSIRSQLLMEPVMQNESILETIPAVESDEAQARINAIAMALRLALSQPLK